MSYEIFFLEHFHTLKAHRFVITLTKCEPLNLECHSSYELFDVKFLQMEIMKLLNIFEHNKCVDVI